MQATLWVAPYGGYFATSGYAAILVVIFVITVDVWVERIPLLAEEVWMRQADLQPPIADL